MMYQTDDDCGFDGVHQLPHAEINLHHLLFWIISINHVVQCSTNDRRLKLRELETTVLTAMEK